MAVGPRAQIESRYVGAQTVDAKGKLMLPGFVNGHTHVPMTLFRGLHDDVTLNDWLYKYIFPAEAKNVNEEFVRWGTRLAAAEQIRSGVTTFADMYYFEDAVAEETKAAGMRAVLGETFIDFPAPDNKTNAAMLAYTENFLKKWTGRSADSCGAGATFDLHVLGKDAARCGGAGTEVSGSDSHPHVGDEKGMGRQPKTERDVSRAIHGQDRPAGTGCRGCTLHLCRCGGLEDACAKESRMRAQSVEQHDDRERRVAGRRDAGRRSCGWSRHGRPCGKQQRSRFDGGD